MGWTLVDGQEDGDKRHLEGGCLSKGIVCEMAKVFSARTDNSMVLWAP